MASINNVITVQLIPEGQLAQRDNMNICCIMTSEQGSVLSSENRFQSYVDLASVAADFGTDSQAYAFAAVFFAQQRSPVGGEGELVLGFWRATDESVAASAATLTGIQLSEAEIVGELQLIADGSFDIDIDGVTKVLTGLDFQSSTTFADIIAVLNTNLVGGTASEVDQKIIITSDTTGVLSLIDYPVAGVAGTFVGELLNLADGTGAVTVQGADAVVLSAETKIAGITAVHAEKNFKGGMFIDNPTDVESKDLATWAQASSVLLYDVFNSSTNLDVDPTNIVWDIKLSTLTNYRMLFSAANNRRLAAGYMSRMHVVNFAGENTALTMHLKEIKGVAAEDYTQTEINSAKTVGLDIYTTIKNVTALLTSGANDFTDNRYNLIAFIDAVQTDMFNLLKQTGTKIPQTIRGVNQMLDTGEKTTKGFVTAGVFAPGTWSSPDYFGDLDTFNQAIEREGFYWKSQSLADQSQADRQDRKSPVLQCAVKNAGAIHSANIIINFNI